MTIYVVTEHDSHVFTNIHDAINYAFYLEFVGKCKKIEIISDDGFRYDYLNMDIIESITTSKQVM